MGIKKIPTFIGIFDWLRIVKDVRTIIERQNKFVYIPNLSPQDHV